jgi:hypothetical protein
MERFSVDRSPLRQFIIGLVGLLLIVAAIEIVWVHEITLEPERADAGQLTTRGQARRRVDLIWGSAFLVTGAGLLVVSLAGLVRHESVVEGTDDGLRLRVAGPQGMISIPWGDIIAVRSGSVSDDGRVAIPVLHIDVDDPHRYPTDLWGGEWDGNTMRVDAESWSIAPEEVAVRAQIALERYRRDNGDEPIEATDEEPIPYV